MLERLHLGLRVLQRDSEALQDASRNAFTFAQEAKQEVVGADLRGLVRGGLLLGEVQRVARGGAQRRLDQKGSATLADHEIEGLPQADGVDAEASDDGVDERIAGVEQAVEEVLGANGFMIEPQGDLARLRERPAGIVVVAIEPTHFSLFPYRACA